MTHVLLTYEEVEILRKQHGRIVRVCGVEPGKCWEVLDQEERSESRATSQGVPDQHA